jgi:hypothetical protein
MGCLQSQCVQSVFGHSVCATGLVCAAMDSSSLYNLCRSVAQTYRAVLSKIHRDKRQGVYLMQ